LAVCGLGLGSRHPYVDDMRETQAELDALQQLLDRSHARATEHLRSIIHGGRTLSAADITALLTGMKVAALATVTATGEPRISAVDGHFLHGTWTWSTSGTAAKARHLQARAAVSIAHIDNEDLAVFAHGHAERLGPADSLWEETLSHWTAAYGGSPLEWGDDIRIYRLAASWMVGYAPDREKLLTGRAHAEHQQRA
jgi:general stress protein 26